MPKHYEFEGAKFVKLEDHEAETGRIKDRAVGDFKKTEDYQNTIKSLSGYQTAEKIGNIKSKYLSSYKVKGEYSDDVITLAGIKPDMEEKEIKENLNKFSQNEKYKNFFESEEVVSNDTATPSNTTQPTSTPARGGGAFWDKVFKK